MSIIFKPQIIQDEHILRVYDSMYLFDKMRSCVDFNGEHIQHYFYKNMMIFDYIDQANQIKWFACFPVHVVMKDKPYWMLTDNAYFLFPKGSEFVEALVPDCKGQAKKVSADHLNELYRQISNEFDVPTLSLNADGDTLLQPHVVSEITGESVPRVIYMYSFGTDLIDELAVDWTNTPMLNLGRYIYCLREKEATLDAIEAYKEIDIEKIMSLNRDNILDAFIRDLFDSCRFKARRLWKLNCGVSMEHRDVDKFDGSVVSQITNSTMESVTQHFLAAKNVGKLKDK